MLNSVESPLRILWSSTTQTFALMSAGCLLLHKLAAYALMINLTTPYLKRKKIISSAVHSLFKVTKTNRVCDVQTIVPRFDLKTNCYDPLLVLQRVRKAWQLSDLYGPALTLGTAM
jgi:hypothetical protein